MGALTSTIANVNSTTNLENIYNNLNSTIANVQKQSFLRGVEGKSIQSTQLTFGEIVDTIYGVEEDYSRTKHILGLFFSGETYKSEWFTGTAEQWAEEVAKIQFDVYYTQNDDNKQLASSPVQIFIDPRLEFIKNYNGEYNFNDKSCTISIASPLATPEIVIKALPRLYFSSDTRTFCWEINGVQTGISAQGRDGEDATTRTLIEANAFAFDTTEYAPIIKTEYNSDASYFVYSFLDKNNDIVRYEGLETADDVTANNVYAQQIESGVLYIVNVKSLNKNGEIMLTDVNKITDITTPVSLPDFGDKISVDEDTTYELTDVNYVETTDNNITQSELRYYLKWTQIIQDETYSFVGYVTESQFITSGVYFSRLKRSDFKKQFSDVEYTIYYVTLDNTSAINLLSFIEQTSTDDTCENLKNITTIDSGSGTADNTIPSNFGLYTYTKTENSNDQPNTHVILPYFVDNGAEENLVFAKAVGRSNTIFKPRSSYASEAALFTDIVSSSTTPNKLTVLNYETDFKRNVKISNASLECSSTTGTTKIEPGLLVVDNAATINSTGTGASTTLSKPLIVNSTATLNNNSQTALTVTVNSTNSSATFPAVNIVSNSTVDMPLTATALRAEGKSIFTPVNNIQEGLRVMSKDSTTERAGSGFAAIMWGQTKFCGGGKYTNNGTEIRPTVVINSGSSTSEKDANGEIVHALKTIGAVSITSAQTKYAALSVENTGMYDNFNNALLVKGSSCFQSNTSSNSALRLTCYNGSKIDTTTPTALPDADKETNKPDWCLNVKGYSQFVGGGRDYSNKKRPVAYFHSRYTDVNAIETVGGALIGGSVSAKGNASITGAMSVGIGGDYVDIRLGTASTVGGSVIKDSNNNEITTGGGLFIKGSGNNPGTTIKNDRIVTGSVTASSASIPSLTASAMTITANVTKPILTVTNSSQAVSSSAAGGNAIYATGQSVFKSHNIENSAIVVQCKDVSAAKKYSLWSTGWSIFEGSATVKSSSSVGDGSLLVEGNATVNKELIVQGATSLNNSLSVQGSVTNHSNLRQKSYIAVGAAVSDDNADYYDSKNKLGSSGSTATGSTKQFLDVQIGTDGYIPCGNVSGNGGGIIVVKGTSAKTNNVGSINGTVICKDTITTGTLKTTGNASISGILTANKIGTVKYTNVSSKATSYTIANDVHNITFYNVSSNTFVINVLSETSNGFTITGINLVSSDGFIPTFSIAGKAKSTDNTKFSSATISIYDINGIPCNTNTTDKLIIQIQH